MKTNQQAGFDACIDGLFESQNPHTPGTQSFQEWSNGWNEAYPIRAEWEQANHDAARA